jgi:hypothetical protein
MGRCAVTTPEPKPDHLGRAQKVLAILAFFAGSIIALVRFGMWFATATAPPVSVHLPPELAAEVSACRELARILRQGSPPVRQSP